MRVLAESFKGCICCRAHFRLDGGVSALESSVWWILFYIQGRVNSLIERLNQRRGNFRLTTNRPRNRRPISNFQNSCFLRVRQITV